MTEQLIVRRLMLTYIMTQWRWVARSLGGSCRGPLDLSPRGHVNKCTKTHVRTVG